MPRGKGSVSGEANPSYSEYLVVTFIAAGA